MNGIIIACMFLACIPLSLPSKSFHLLHTNDIHSRFLLCDSFGGKCSENCFGGILRRSSLVNFIRKQDKSVLLFDAGDQLTGTLWYNVFKGNASAYFINNLRYDAVTLGNHEFDLGNEHLVSYLEQLRIPVVVSNLYTDRDRRWDHDPPLFNRSFVITKKNTTIGLCGYTLKSTPRYSNPGPNISFHDEIEAVKICSKEHTTNGIKIIIAIGHGGFELDKQVAKLVEDVDVVIGGHSNTFLYNGKPPTKNIPKGPYPKVIKGTKHVALVVQSYAFGIYLGNLSVTFDNNGRLTAWSGQPILLDETISDDASLKEKVEKMTKEVNAVAKRKIGTTVVDLDGKLTSCGHEECNLGNLMADAMIASYLQSSKGRQNGKWAPASIAIWSAGSIMGSIDSSRNNSIYYDDLYNAFPYQNTIDCISIYGQDLRQIMEFALADLTTTSISTRFMQVSGLKILIDINRELMTRIIDIKTRCLNCSIPKYEPLDDKLIYKVLLPSYIARGGSGFLPYTASFLSTSEGDRKDVDIIADYVERLSPITIGIEGRIQYRESGIEPYVSAADTRKIPMWAHLISIFLVYYDLSL